MPYSPSCLERLSGKCPKASQRRVFGSEKGPNSGSFVPPGGPGASIRAPFRVSRQSLEGAFCELRLRPVLRSCAVAGNRSSFQPRTWLSQERKVVTDRNIRPAEPGDAAAVRDLVRAGYAGDVGRIGQPPAPSL